MNLIKQINNSLKPKDPVANAIASLDESMDDPTYLHDDQIDTLVDYMKEMIDDAKVRHSLFEIKEAALMALDDVAGFETASAKVLKRTQARLMAAYIKKYGNT